MAKKPPPPPEPGSRQQFGGGSIIPPEDVIVPTARSMRERSKAHREARKDLIGLSIEDSMRRKTPMRRIKE